MPITVDNINEDVEFEEDMKKAFSEEEDVDPSLTSYLDVTDRDLIDSSRGRLPAEDGGLIAKEDYDYLDMTMSDRERAQLSKEISNKKTANPKLPPEKVYDEAIAPFVADAFGSTPPTDEEKAEVYRYGAMPYRGAKYFFTKRAQGARVSFEGEAAKLRDAGESVSGFNEVKKNLMSTPGTSSMVRQIQGDLMSQGIDTEEAEYRAVLEVAKMTAETQDKLAGVFRNVEEFGPYQVAPEDMPKNTLEQVLFQMGQMPQTMVEFGISPVVGTAGVYMLEKGAIAEDIEKGLEKFPGLTPDQKKKITDEASSLGAAAATPLEAVGSMFQISKILGKAGFSKFMVNILESMGAEGLTEYAQTYPEEIAVMWAMNRGLTVPEFIDFVKSKMGEIHAKATESAKIGALTGGATVAVGSTVANSLDYYISAKQKEIYNKNKPATPDDVDFEPTSTKQVEEIQLTERDIQTLDQLAKVYPQAQAEGKPFSVGYDVETNQFVKSTNENFRPWMLTQHDPKALHDMVVKGEVRLFQLPGRNAGYGITTEKAEVPNQLVLFHSNKDPKSGAGRTMIEHAIENGADNLEVYDLHGMVDFYKKFGFEEVERMPFNEEYADPSWDYENQGKPDYVVMKLSPEAETALDDGVTAKEIFNYMGKKGMSAKQLRKFKQKLKEKQTTKKDEVNIVVEFWKKANEAVNKGMNIPNADKIIDTFKHQLIPEAQLDPMMKEMVREEKERFRQAVLGRVRLTGEYLEGTDTVGSFYDSLVKVGISEDDAALITTIFESLADASVEKGKINNKEEFFGFWFNNIALYDIFGKLEDTAAGRRIQGDPPMDNHDVLLETASDIWAYVSVLDIFQGIPQTIRILDVAVNQALADQIAPSVGYPMKDFTRKVLEFANHEGRLQFKPELYEKIKEEFKNNKGDLYTYVIAHESGHLLHNFLYFHDKALYNEVAAHFGEDPNVMYSVWKADNVELFADSFARYILSGKAPISKLKVAFERMRIWFEAIVSKFLFFKIGPGSKGFDTGLYKIFDKMFQGKTAEEAVATEETKYAANAAQTEFNSGTGAFLNKKYQEEIINKSIETMAGIGADPNVGPIEYATKEIDVFDAVGQPTGKKTLSEPQRGSIDMASSPITGPEMPIHKINWETINDASHLTETTNRIASDIATIRQQTMDFLGADPNNPKSHSPGTIAAMQERFEAVAPGMTEHLTGDFSNTKKALSQELGVMTRAIDATDPDVLMANRIILNDKLVRLNEIATKATNPNASKDSIRLLEAQWTKEKSQYFALVNHIRTGDTNAVNSELNTWILPEGSPDKMRQAFKNRLRAAKGKGFKKGWFSRGEARYFSMMYERGDGALALQKMFRKGPFDMLFESRVNGVLSGPATQLVNFFGTLANVGIDPVERILFGGLASKARKKLQGTDQYGDINNEVLTTGEGLAELVGMWNGFKDFFKVYSMRKVFSELGNGPEDIKNLDISGKAITSENLKRWLIMRNFDRKSNKLSTLYKGFDIFGKGIRIVTNAMNLSDKLFTDFIGYRGLLHANAYRYAYNEALQNNANLNPSDPNWIDMRDRYRDILANPENYKLDNKSVDSKSLDEAMALAFKADITGAGAKIIDALNAIPTMRWFVLFKKTPWNVAKQVPMRTPILRRFTKEYEEASGADRDMLDAKMGTGLLLSAIMCGFVFGLDTYDEEKGIDLPLITGAGPTNSKQREVWKRLGLQPYSIKNPFNGTYIDIRRFQPVSSYPMLWADIADTTERVYKLYNDNPPEEVKQELLRISLAAAMALAKRSTEQTFLDSLTQLYDLFDGAFSSDNPSVKSFANDARAKYLNRLLTSMMPFSGMLRASEKASDPYLREAQSLLEEFRKGVPGLGEMNYPQRNFWGEPVEYHNSAATRFLSPFYTSKINLDPVDIEIFKLMKAGESVRAYLPSHTMSIDGVPINLNSDEYNAYIMILNDRDYDPDISKEGPSKLKEKINDLITSTDYGRKDNRVRAKMISNEIGKAEDKAKERLLEVFPYMRDTIDKIKTNREIELEYQRITRGH